MGPIIENNKNIEDFSKNQRIETLLGFINTMISMGVECNNIIIYDYETGCILHDIWHEIPYSEYMHDMALKMGYAFPDYYVVECVYNKVSKNFKIYVRG